MDVTDDERMRMALDLAEGRPNDAAHLLRGRGTQRAIVLRVVGMLCAVGVGVGLALLWFSPDGRRTSAAEVAPATASLAIGCSVVGVVLVLGTLAWLARKGRLRSGWQHLAFALTRRQRRDIRRQILGRRPAVPTQLPVARAFAVETVRQAPQVFMMAGLVLTTLGSSLNSTFRLSWWLFAIVVVSAIVAGWQILRGVSRARRFLADHPAPVTEVVS